MSDARRSGPDVRFRPFRAAMYGLYLVVVGTFCLLVIISVVKSVIEMSPRRPKETDTVLSFKECVDKAESLWAQLEAKRQSLTDRAPASRADENWATFRVEWLQRQRQTEAACAVGSAERASIREAYRGLDKAMDLYTTHAVQYAGEVGPTIDALQTSLSLARTQLGQLRR